MAVFIDTFRSDEPAELRAANCVTIGLINNMPDPALEATERQFVELLRAAATNAVVRLVLFSIPEVPRAEIVRQEIDERYRPISELWDMHLDGLIVTGTEPRSKKLQDEPYWDTLSAVVAWARENTASTIWSCLAAHAAVLQADGIERYALNEKVFGVLDCEPVGSHPMTSDAAEGIQVPHSRYNDLPERALADCGYRILTRSEAGVDMFARQERSFHLFMQGHPEYEATTLLREYRRDIGRFLRQERDAYPAMPQGYFTQEAIMIASAFRKRALADRRDHLLASFPVGALESGLESPWRSCAIGIYEKWVAFLMGRKAEQRPQSALTRRAWRDWPQGALRPAADGSAR
jgi:homoserine O-succinyltransferase